MTLAPGLLDGATVALAGHGAVADVLALRLGSLGAAVEIPDAASVADEATFAEWATTRGPWRGLVVEAGEGFGDGGPERLTATLDHAWRAIRAVAGEAMLGAAEPARIVLVAPAPGAGPHAGAVRAALENLARTLSVEWARHGVTPVALLPGDSTAAAEIAELTAFLISPAGAYFSGCRFALGAI